MAKVNRIVGEVEESSHYWRALSSEEWHILEDSPDDYGRSRDKLKELDKAKKLKDCKCVQMSTSEYEARGWLPKSGGVLIRVCKAKLDEEEWETVDGHQFVFVTGAAIVRLKEVVT